MNYSTMIFLLDNTVRAASCAYELDSDGKPSKLYTFKTFDQTLKKGDLVIVPTSTRVGFTVCRFEEYTEIDIDSTIDYKWLAGRFDPRVYHETVAAEAKAIDVAKSAEKRRRREALREAVFKDQKEALEEASLLLIAARPASEQKG